ncbi:MAG: VWA domain-containing protein [Chitinophagales bacterium]|nr:VWA domain-containing protein [Chitinophagales bacterium]MDW8274047.1 VWA domain-containing protein [Chitinophagales bacterium]
MFLFDAFSAAELQNKTRILFLMDASYSMNKPWTHGTRWFTAQQVMYEIIDSLNGYKNVEFAIRVFGHQSSLRENNCRDSRLEFPFGSLNPNLAKKKLSLIKPNGVTPLAYSLEKCAGDFSIAGGESRNFLIVITDGEESCEGKPCEAAALLLQNHIILKPIVLGIQLPEVLQEQFGCIGELTNTWSADELKHQLVKKVLDIAANTTFQLNLLDHNGKPTETAVPFTLLDAKDSTIKYQFFHTLNHQGAPDTISVSPIFNYNIIVHTLPPVQLNNISMLPNKHNIINMPAPQGFAEFKFNGNVLKNPQVQKIKCVIFQDGIPLTAISHNEKEKLISGTYEADILTLPPFKGLKLSVEGGKTSTLTVPAPGLLHLRKSAEVAGAIMTFQDNKLIKVTDLADVGLQESFALQPGKYLLLYREKKSDSMLNTKELQFEIKSGMEIRLDI